MNKQNHRVIGLWIVLVLVAFAAGVAHGRLMGVNTASRLETTTAVSMRPSEVEVAKVFGRSRGCSSAGPVLIKQTADAAERTGLQPAVVAAIVATESNCLPTAVSSRGAVGLMQVRVSSWQGKFDFMGVDNPFNPAVNLRVGTTILAGLVKTHGLRGGIRLYQGAGVGCPSCDDSYTAKILRARSGGGR